MTSNIQSTEAHLRITNTLGAIVLESHCTPSELKNGFPITLHGLSSGLYRVEVISDKIRNLGATVLVERK